MCCTIEDVGTKMCLCAYADHEWQDITTLLCYSQAAELSLAADAFAYAGLHLVPAPPGPWLASGFHQCITSQVPPCRHAHIGFL